MGQQHTPEMFWLVARVNALSMLVSAIAKSSPNKDEILRQFDAAAETLQVVLLNGATNEDFLQQELVQLAELRSQVTK
jgi:non-ribosomal peptide synthetase component E (peptide arylation enzyme)